LKAKINYLNLQHLYYFKVDSEEKYLSNTALATSMDAQEKPKFSLEEALQQLKVGDTLRIQYDSTLTLATYLGNDDELQKIKVSRKIVDMRSFKLEYEIEIPYKDIQRIEKFEPKKLF
jgi:hypothetical protein